MSILILRCAVGNNIYKLELVKNIVVNIKDKPNSQNMFSQLSDLEFFYLLYAFYKTLDEQVKNCNKPGDLIDQFDCDFYARSHKNGKRTYLHLMILEFFFQSISVFHIVAILQRLDLNGPSNRE